MKKLLSFCLAGFLGVGGTLTAASSDPEKIAGRGVLFGAYMDFGESEDNVTLEGMEAFERLAGKSPAIVASSSYWGEQSFPSKNLALIARHGAIPMVYWSPWDKPYDENKGPDRFALTEILAGKWDSYIDSWADGAKDFAKPFFVSFCNEMNGDWFPWSGYYYGAENGGPEVFKKAWRHVVERVKARGADNILWVLHFNAFPAVNDEWNVMASYYPGSGYVDWLGLSVYGKQFRNEGDWANFQDLIQWPYKEICALDSKKPVMLAEFGVGDFPKSGDKARWIRDALKMIPGYPRIKAAIYWHERWQNEDGTYSNLRINSSPQALEEFRKEIACPEWIGSKGKSDIP